MEKKALVIIVLLGAMAISFLIGWNMAQPVKIAIAERSIDMEGHILVPEETYNQMLGALYWFDAQLYECYQALEEQGVGEF
jgi:hypothetical protein